MSARGTSHLTRGKSLRRIARFVADSATLARLLGQDPDTSISHRVALAARIAKRQHRNGAHGKAWER